MASSPQHIPVLLTEVLAAIQPANNEIIVDGTLGAGGYTKAILKAASCEVWAFDQDPQILTTAQEIARENPKRFHFIQACFGSMKKELKQRNIEKVDCIVLDIGVSSMQIDQAERGFSFQKEGPLDMRMGTQKKTAADLVNTLSAEALADIFYYFGEEKRARQVAKAIIEQRKIKPFTTTAELVKIIHQVVFKKGKTDPATKTFQALRIAVNDEFGELKRGLKAAEEILKPGGRLAVVTFHSLEDGLVKQFLKERSPIKKSINKYKQNTEERGHYSFTVTQKKPIIASKEEIELNPRARSAKLRWAIRTQNPVMKVE